MVLHHCRRCESKNLYFHFSVCLNVSVTEQTSIFILYTYSISYFRRHFRLRKSVHRKTNKVFIFGQNEHNLTKRSPAQSAFFNFISECWTGMVVRWHLQDYSLLNILKWINLGKTVGDIFSLAWKPFRITPHNIPRYTYWYIHIFFRLKSNTRSLLNNPVVSVEAVIFLHVLDGINPKVYDKSLISLIWRARSTLICVTKWTSHFNWFTSDARGS